MATNCNATIDELEASLKEQFKKTKSYAQCVTELKEIHQEVNESVWEADQWLKYEIMEWGFEYDDRKHMEWFIAMLLPHLRMPMNQQTFESQEKAVEAAPWEDTPVGVQQIQEQLGAMHLEI